MGLVDGTTDDTHNSGKGGNRRKCVALRRCFCLSQRLKQGRTCSLSNSNLHRTRDLRSETSRLTTVWHAYRQQRISKIKFRFGGCKPKQHGTSDSKQITKVFPLRICSFPPINRPKISTRSDVASQPTSFADGPKLPLSTHLEKESIGCSAVDVAIPR